MILICAATAKAKHTRMCDNLISVHQNCVRGKQRAQLSTIKVLALFSSITVFLSFDLY